MFLEVQPSHELFAFYDQIDTRSGEMEFSISVSQEDERAYRRLGEDILQHVLENKPREPRASPFTIYNVPTEFDSDYRGSLYTDEAWLSPDGGRQIVCRNVALDLDFYWYCGKIIVSERLADAFEQWHVPLYKRSARVLLDGQERQDLSFFEIVLRACRPAFDYHRSGDLIAKRQMAEDSITGRRRPMPVNLFGHVVWNPPCEIEEAVFREAYSNRMLASRAFAQFVADAGIRGIGFCEMRTG